MDFTLPHAAELFGIWGAVDKVRTKLLRLTLGVAVGLMLWLLLITGAVVHPTWDRSHTGYSA